MFGGVVTAVANSTAINENSKARWFQVREFGPNTAKGDSSRFLDAFSGLTNSYFSGRQRGKKKFISSEVKTP